MQPVEMTLSVFTSKDWNSLYPKNEYLMVLNKDPMVTEDVRKKVQNGLVEYLIALNQSDDTVMRQVAKKPALLRHTSNRHGLSILDLAIMKGRESLVSKLLDQGASLDQPDAYGWLPVHHAALAGDRLFKLIVQRGADPNKTTRLGGTCEDLRQLAGIVELTTSLKGLSLETEDKQHVSFDPNQHLQLFGMTKYTDVPYYPEEHIKRLWIQKKEPSDFEEQFEFNNRAAFEGAFQKPAKVVVKRLTVGGESGAHWGLFADEDLPFGATLFTYTGQYAEYERHGNLNDILNGKVTPRPYLLDNIDAQFVGNCSRFMNEGFPNCMPFHATNYKGIERRYAFMVIQKEGVKKGEELLWDYGQGEFQLKWNKLYRLPNPVAMHEFVKTHTMKDIEKFCHEGNCAVSSATTLTEEIALNQFRGTGYISQMVYCFSTPAAILDLWCGNCITARDWINQIQGSELYNILIAEDHKVMIVFVKDFLKLLGLFEEDSEKKKKYIGEIKTFIRPLQGELTYLEIMDILNKILEWLNQDSDNWEQFSAHLRENYKHIEGREIK